MRTKALMSTGELAEIFDVSRVTIRRWRQSGKLQAIQVGRELRFRLSDIERLVGEPVHESSLVGPAVASPGPEGGNAERVGRPHDDVTEVRR